MVPNRIGRYEVLGQLATGGMAEILLARLEGPSDFRRAVVIKRILRRYAQTSSFVAMFLDEARIVAKIRHPNVVQVHELGEHTITTRDHVLDIWVPGETGEPQWKDEDELDAALRVGRVSPEQAVSIRAEGERVWRERPWPTGWEDWRPPAGWTAPELPEGWAD